MNDAGSGKQSPAEDWIAGVWAVVQGIPRGRVLTYGEVARLAGNPGAARRVSHALRRAPPGMRLHWHRVINSQGRISLPAGSAAHRQQKRRLEKEGVVFLRGRIDLARFGYRAALDQILWQEPA